MLHTRGDDTTVVFVLFAVDTDLGWVEVAVAGVELHRERLAATVLFHSTVLHLNSDLQSTYFLLQLTDCTHTSQHILISGPRTTHFESLNTTAVDTWNAVQLAARCQVLASQICSQISLTALRMLV